MRIRCISAQRRVGQSEHQSPGDFGRVWLCVTFRHVIARSYPTEILSSWHYEKDVHFCGNVPVFCNSLVLKDFVFKIINCCVDIIGLFTMVIVSVFNRSVTTVYYTFLWLLHAWFIVSLICIVFYRNYFLYFVFFLLNVI